MATNLSRLAVIPLLASLVASPVLAGSVSTMTLRDAYKLGYVAGYHAAVRKFHGEGSSKSALIPSDSENPFSLSTTFQNEHTVESDSGLFRFRVTPGYQFSKQVSLTGRFGFDALYGPAKGTVAEDGLLKVNHTGWALSKVTQLSASSEVVLPISEKSRAQDSLVTRIRLIPKVAFDFSPLGANGLGSFFKLTLARGFHTRSASTTGSANTAYTVAPEVGIGYQIAQPVSIAAGFIRYFHFDYGGRGTDEFENYQEIDVTVAPKLSLALGHDNDTSTLSFTSPASMIYSNLSYSL